MGLRFAEWDVWSTHVQIGADDERALEHAVRIAHDVIADVTLAASRFEPGTDVLRVNERAGEWVTVSPTMITLVTEAIRVASITNGLVTPLVGRSLIGIGYDTDIAAVGGGTITVIPVENDWRRVELDADRIRIPEHTMIDLGASAKAWTADRIAALACADGRTPVLVGIGGDVAVAGDRDEGFLIEVAERPEPQRGDADAQRIRVRSGGVATSTTVQRRWSTQDGVVHHIIDPRTALPARAAFRTVTVAAASCSDANAASTAAIILAEAAPPWLENAQLPARLISDTGTVITVGNWPDAAE